MAIIKNTDFVIDGNTYTMNQNQIIMGSDVIVLCSRPDGVGDLKVAKFIVNSEDETASYLELLPDISMSRVASDENYFQNGYVLLKISETSAYILVHSSGDDDSGQNDIWQLSKSGSTYSISNIRTVSYNRSAPPTNIPRINMEICFGLVPDNNYIYYTGYNWGLDYDKIYAYDPITDTLYTHVLSSDFYSGGSEKSAILAWRDRVWITNGTGDVAGILIDSVNAFGVGDDVYIASDSGITSTPVTNLVTPFGDSELWASCGKTYYDLSTQFVIKYDEDTDSYYKTVYTVNSLNFDLKSHMSYFGQFHHQRLYGYIQISTTTAYVISASHASLGNYSVYLYKCVKDDVAHVLNTTCLMRIPGPNVPIELFSLSGKHYIIFGYGTGGNGADVAIYRIDESLPPKILMLTNDIVADVNDSVDLNGQCLFDSEVTSINNVSLYRNGTELVSYIASSIYPTSPTFSCSIEAIPGVYSFLGTVVGGVMDGVEIMSNAMTLSTVTYATSAGHIGAFYLGNAIDVTNYVDPVSMTINVSDVDVSNIGGTGIEVTPMIVPKLRLTIPTIEVSIQDNISIELTADRWCGTTPLTVNFEVNPIFSNEYSSLYEIDYCYWNFDAGSSNEYTTSATGATISHDFSGYFNQQYGIKVQAHFIRKVEDINYPETQVATSEIKYVRLCGVEEVRYTSNRLLNLVNYIPSMYRNTDVETILGDIFQDYWNTMFDGNDGLTIYESSLDLSSCYSDMCQTCATTQYFQIT